MYPLGQPAKSDEVVLYIFEEFLLICKPKKPKYLQKRKRKKNCFETKSLPIVELKLINLTTEDFFGFELDRGERNGMALTNCKEKLVFKYSSFEETNSIRVELNRLIKTVTHKRLQELNKSTEPDSPRSCLPQPKGMIYILPYVPHAKHTIGGSMIVAPRSSTEPTPSPSGGGSTRKKNARGLSAFLISKDKNSPPATSSPATTEPSASTKLKNLGMVVHHISPLLMS